MSAGVVTNGGTVHTTEKTIAAVKPAEKNITTVGPDKPGKSVKRATVVTCGRSPKDGFSRVFARLDGVPPAEFRALVTGRSSRRS